jgi:hypothetical protein
MNTEDLLAHRVQLVQRLETIELEKSQLVRKLKAIDVLLEGSDPVAEIGAEHIDKEMLTMRQVTTKKPRKRIVPPHTVRFSARTSLIGAVEEMALKQPGPFDSVHLLKALQEAYPEFNLGETKHISSPLSDLVERGVLVIERERSGAMPNIYSAVKKPNK